MDCVYQGQAIGEYNIGGKTAVAHLCKKLNAHCTETVDIGVQVCSKCPHQITEAASAKCRHRGQVLRQEDGDLCGFRGVKFDVHECKLHGECSLHRYCANRQIKSCSTCGDFDAVTSVKFEATPQRNLIYHIWPTAHTDVWRWNVEQLLKRIDLFDGRRMIGIVTDGSTRTTKEVQAAFGDTRIDRWLSLPNDPKTGECVTFPSMLDDSLEQPGVTFYGHAKGVKYTEEQPAVTSWSELLYRSCLDDWQAVERSLSQFPITGSMRRRISLSKGYGWHYSGTFFWFRNADVIQRLKRIRRTGNYYGHVEMWPGIMFERSEAGCLFGDGVDNLYDPLQVAMWTDRFNQKSPSSNFA